MTIERRLRVWFGTPAPDHTTRLRWVARLFGKNKLRERAQEIETDDVKWCIDLIQTWLDDYNSGSLREDNETSREQAYNQDFFIRILGYREKPHTPFTFTPKGATDLDLHDQQWFVEPVNRLAQLYREHAESDNFFKTTIKTTFDLRSWPNANLGWWALEATDFIKNFRKRFTTGQVADLLTAHAKQSKIVGDRVAEIIKLNVQIDRQFWKLFGLTRREIELVVAMPFTYV